LGVRNGVRFVKLIIENTTKIVILNGVECRVWEGVTDRGVAIHCFIPLVGVRTEADRSQFEEELLERRAPSADIEAIPMRMLL
jgi:hypothetical protein